LIGAILKLQPHGADSVMHTAFWPEAIGKAMEIAFPDGLHSHQHCALNNPIRQGRDTQWTQLAVRLWNINPFYRLRTIPACQKFDPQLIQMSIQNALQALLIHSVNAWGSCA